MLLSEQDTRLLTDTSFVSGFRLRPFLFPDNQIHMGWAYMSCAGWVYSFKCWSVLLYSTSDCPHKSFLMAKNERLTITCEVGSGHVLDGDLLEEGWLLTARVSTHHPCFLQPLTQPGQVTITHVRVGQEVTVEVKRNRERQKINH